MEEIIIRRLIDNISNISDIPNINVSTPMMNIVASISHVQEQVQDWMNESDIGEFTFRKVKSSLNKFKSYFKIP